MQPERCRPVVRRRAAGRICNGGLLQGGGRTQHCELSTLQKRQRRKSEKGNGSAHGNSTKGERKADGYNLTRVRQNLQSTRDQQCNKSEEKYAWSGESKSPKVASVSCASFLGGPHLNPLGWRFPWNAQQTHTHLSTHPSTHHL